MWYNVLKKEGFTLWVFLDKFNAIIGAIMFFVTLINLFISWKINDRINNAVDLHKLKLYKDKEIGNINAFIRKIKIEQKLSPENKRSIELFLSDLRGDYPDIKKFNQKKLIKEISRDNCNYVKINELLKRLITEIERIA